MYIPATIEQVTGHDAIRGADRPARAVIPGTALGQSGAAAGLAISERGNVRRPPGGRLEFANTRGTAYLCFAKRHGAVERSH
jgi:hypothetical protein